MLEMCIKICKEYVWKRCVCNVLFRPCCAALLCHIIESKVVEELVYS